MTWTAERVEELKVLVSEKLSASSIARQLSVTRNAVIGKVYRIGLKLLGPKRGGGTRAGVRGPRPKIDFAASGIEPPERKPRARRQTRRAPRVTFIGYSIEPIPSAEDFMIPIGQRRKFSELNDAMCRYPVGDPRSPDFYFCGGKKLSGVSYCGFHDRLCRPGAYPTCEPVYPAVKQSEAV